MLRKVVANERKEQKDPIRWRGKEVGRIEAFSDAVFAFSITLLIVALEVPESYGALMESMRMFFPFAISFTLLFAIWNTQNTFFRRYGLHDRRTMVLNGMLLFTVLFFVYPLKFLFSAIFNSGHVKVETTEQLRYLFFIYGGGFAAIYLLFALLYQNAYRRREELQLNGAEVFETNTQVYSHFFVACGGICAILIAMLPGNGPSLAGLGFIVIWPLTTLCDKVRGRAYKKKFPLIPHEAVLPVEEPFADMVQDDGGN